MNFKYLIDNVMKKTNDPVIKNDILQRLNITM
jgi:hypothetical protein